MKIGILTLPLHTNYGGILQAYALQTVLERMGYEVTVFDTPKKIKVFTWRLPIMVLGRCIAKFLLGRQSYILTEVWHNKTYPIVSRYTQAFIDKYINRLELADISALSKNEYDILIVGSDQIWRPVYYTHIENAFLSFAREWDVKRIAYAASFGTDKWEYSEKQTQLCGSLLQLFDVVTVREQSGISLCQKHFNVMAQHVLDPTMLLESADYIKLIEVSNISKSEGDMLCYILDETEEKSNFISRIAAHKGMKMFRVNSRIEDKFAPLEERIQPPVEFWLRGFYDAKFVITDSFHACVFAILFQKPFLVIGNRERGLARFESLLSLFDLEDRLVFLDKESHSHEREIDWKDVLKKLSDERTRSLNLLKKGLV